MKTDRRFIGDWFSVPNQFRGDWFQVQAAVEWEGDPELADSLNNSDPIRIYRVENGWGEGPYQQGHTDELQKMYDHHSSSQWHPVPENDGIPHPDGNLHGFTSMRDLHQWFAGYQEDLHDAGFGVSEYHVDPAGVTHGGHQVAFDPNRAEQKRWLTFPVRDEMEEQGTADVPFRKQAEVGRTTVYHLTDDPHFKLNADYAPEDNSISINPRDGRRGLYVGRPEVWRGPPYGYKRPYVVELSMPTGTKEGGRWGGESFIPAEHFDDVSVERVMPYDHYIRREFKSPGETEDYTGHTYDTHEPLERTPKQWGARYPESVDTEKEIDTRNPQQWSDEQHRAYLKQRREYLHDVHGWGWNEFRDDDSFNTDPDDDPRHWDDEGEFIRTDRQGNRMTRGRYAAAEPKDFISMPDGSALVERQECPDCGQSVTKFRGQWWDDDDSPHDCDDHMQREARERPTWSNRMQEPNLLSEFGSVKVPGLLPSHTIHYHPTGEGAACGARTPEGSSNNVTHVTCNKCTTTRAFKMAPTEQRPNGRSWDQVEREDREAAKQRHRDIYHRASANSDLRVEDYAGREGNNTHITRNEYGTVPLAWIRHLHGGAGEKPYEHRNYTGEQWDDFREKVRAGEPGYSSPIFIVVNHGEEPKIYEGNHRRTAYDELERMGQIERPAQVPVEVRYFGHAERQGDLGERYMRRQASVSVVRPFFELFDDHGPRSRMGEGSYSPGEHCERCWLEDETIVPPEEHMGASHEYKENQENVRYSANSVEPSWLADYNPEQQLEGIPREPVRPGDPGKGTGEQWWEYDRQPNKLQAEAMPRDEEYLNDLDFHFRPASGRILYHSIMAMPHGADPENLFAAHGGITWWPAGNGSTSGKIMNVAVNDDKYKRRGLATELLRRAKAKAAEEGLTLRHSLSLLEDGEQMIAGIGDYPGGPVLQAESAHGDWRERRFGSAPFDDEYWSQFDHPPEYAQLIGKGWDAHDMGDRETIYTKGLPEGHSLTLWKRPNPNTGNMWWTMNDSTMPHDPANGVYRGSWHRTLDDALQTARDRGHNVDTHEEHPEPPMTAEEEAEMERQEAEWARQRRQLRPDLPEGDEYRSGPGGGRHAAIQRRIAATSWDEGPDAGHIADFERMGWKRADPEGYAWHLDDPQTGTKHAADWLGNEGWYLTSTAPERWGLEAPWWVTPQIARDVEDKYRYAESEHETPAMLHQQATRNSASFGGFGQTGPKHLRGLKRPEYGIHDTIHDYMPESPPEHSLDYDEDKGNMSKYNKTAGRTPRPRHPDSEMENRLKLLKDRAKPSRLNNEKYRGFWEKVMAEHGAGVPPQDHPDFETFMRLTDPVAIGAPKTYPGMSNAEVRQQWMATPAGQAYKERNRTRMREQYQEAGRAQREEAAAETRRRQRGEETPADIKAWYKRQGVDIDDDAALELHRQRRELPPEQALRREGSWLFDPPEGHVDKLLARGWKMKADDAPDHAPDFTRTSPTTGVTHKLYWNDETGGGWSHRATVPDEGGPSNSGQRTIRAEDPGRPNAFGFTTLADPDAIERHARKTERAYILGRGAEPGIAHLFNDRSTFDDRWGDENRMNYYPDPLWMHNNLADERLREGNPVTGEHPEHDVSFTEFRVPAPGEQWDAEKGHYEFDGPPGENPTGGIEKLNHYSPFNDYGDWEDVGDRPFDLQSYYRQMGMDAYADPHTNMLHIREPDRDDPEHWDRNRNPSNRALISILNDPTHRIDDVDEHGTMDPSVPVGESYDENRFRKDLPAHEPCQRCWVMKGEIVSREEHDNHPAGADHSFRGLNDTVTTSTPQPHTSSWERVGMGMTPRAEASKAFDYDDPNAVYLRFGDWPHDEQSENFVTGFKEFGVSAYDIDKQGEPLDSDSAMNRGIHHYDAQECGPLDDYGRCEEHGMEDKEQDPDYGNDTDRVMWDKIERARYSGNRAPGARAHLVKGDLAGFGHDDEPLLKNVRAVGHWPCDVHKFVPGLTPNSGAAAQFGTEWCNHHDHDEESMEHYGVAPHVFCAECDVPVVDGRCTRCKREVHVPRWLQNQPVQRAFPIIREDPVHLPELGQSAKDDQFLNDNGIERISVAQTPGQQGANDFLNSDEYWDQVTGNPLYAPEIDRSRLDTEPYVTGYQADDSAYWSPHLDHPDQDPPEHSTPSAFQHVDPPHREDLLPPGLQSWDEVTSGQHGAGWSISHHNETHRFHLRPLSREGYHEDVDHNKPMYYESRSMGPDGISQVHDRRIFRNSRDAIDHFAVEWAQASAGRPMGTYNLSGRYSPTDHQMLVSNGYALDHQRHSTTGRGVPESHEYRMASQGQEGWDHVLGKLESGRYAVISPTGLPLDTTDERGSADMHQFDTLGQAIHHTNTRERQLRNRVQ